MDETLKSFFANTLSKFDEKIQKIVTDVILGDSNIGKKLQNIDKFLEDQGLSNEELHTIIYLLVEALTQLKNY